MKKIINGKLYDTETAKRIGVDSYSNTRDFHYWSEELYVKRTGEYFLHGEGGPASRYAKAVDGNSWTGGEKIIPMSDKAAREWAEEHLDADDYEAAFGMPDEGDSELLSVQLPAPMMEAIRQRAKAEGKNVSEWVRGMLSEAIK